MKTPFDLSGKHALVTGASRGIGRAIALELARAGADLILTSRKTESLERVAAEIEKLGRKAVVAPADLGKPDTIAAMADCLAADSVPVDILVNNGAFAHMNPLLETEVRTWHKMLDVNLTGPWLLTKTIVPLMRNRGGGAIVNVASIAGLEPAFALGAYAVSKAALIHMTRILAHELAPDNIRVNAVAPGIVETDLAKALIEDKRVYKSLMNGTALGRHAQPEEIAPTVLHLVSPASSYITGQIIRIDGGRSG